MRIHLFIIAAVLGISPVCLAREISCPGTYGGHLQGLATDEEFNIFWSFTVAIVKTDKAGNLLKAVEAPNHQGDLTYVDGKVYVAVNLGRFNREPGEADSWVYVFDAENLELLEKKEVPELVHGAGGMAYHDGTFVIIGGLPEGYNENYVYEYDKDLNFLRRHVVDSGYTRLGIQTACWLNGAWWFGCYENEGGLLKTDTDFNLLGRYNPNYAVGIAPWKDGTCLRGVSIRIDEEERRVWAGRAVVDTPGRAPDDSSE